MVGTNKKALVIANAMDFLDQDARQRAADREITDMQSLGFKPEELDLRDYFGKQHELAAKLNDYGLVWARGGNGFLLRQAMERSGFDKVLLRRLTDDNFTYAGYSAGIVVLTPTLEGIELVDPVDARPHGYESQVIWRGIGVLDYCIAPHFKSDHPESEAINDVVEYFDQHGLPYKTLHDGEAIVVRGTKEEIVS